MTKSTDIQYTAWPKVCLTLLTPTWVVTIGHVYVALKYSTI